MVGKKAEGRIWRQIWLEKLACAFQAVIHVPDSVICLWRNLSDTERLKADLDLHREGSGVPLQHSCLENPMDGGAWWAAVHGVAKSRTRLSDFTLTFHFHALKKEMATHSSVLAWRIPGTEEPGGLPSMGSHRVRHDWSDLAAAAAAQYIMILYAFFLTMKRLPPRI